jgi:threonine dehydrogenase-like Zn-dependent dehydrogenase
MRSTTARQLVGAGPVGQFAIRSTLLLGAKEVVCMDNVPNASRWLALEAP